MTTDAATYPGYRLPAEIISHVIWLYFRFPLIPCHAARWRRTSHRSRSDPAWWTARAAHVANIQQVTIKPIITATIAQGNLVHTDEYNAYAWTRCDVPLCGFEGPSTAMVRRRKSSLRRAAGTRSRAWAGIVL